MIQDKIKELKEINKLIDIEETVMSQESELGLLKFKRDEIISEIETEINNLLDFDNWKEWKSSVYLYYEKSICRYG
jgi:hypothetical protein